MQDLTINISEMVRKHWFKVLVVVLVLYIYVKKDFNFHFNISEKKEAPTQLPAGSKYTQQASSATELSVLDGALQLFSKSNNAQQSADLDLVAPDIQLQYVKRFGKVAIQEQKKYGIPASVTLAMALLQSAAGTSELSKNQNNHFGMIQNEGSFRSYDSAWASFRDHSIWASGIVKANGKDYKTWVNEIAKASGRDDSYRFAILTLIEDNKFYRLDVGK